MAIMDQQNGDHDIMRVWSLLTEVSEQLSQSRTVSVSLHSLAGGIKTQAIHSQTGFVLRRFNLDKPKDVYDAELERMNAAMSADNQMLLNDNRQLNTLIREYEQTLENLMSTFRTRAYEVQEHELALMREYESVIVQRESEALDVALAASNSRSEHLARVGRLLRAVMRKLGGEDIQAYERMSVSEGSSAFMVEVSSSAISATDHTRPEPNENSTSTVEDKEDSYAELARELDGEEEPDRFQRRLAAAEWALERESELARLEQENEELRRLLKGVLNADASAALPAPAVPRPEPPSGERVQSGRTSPALSTSSSGTVRRQLGGPAGTVGPFGTYKKRVSG